MSNNTSHDASDKEFPWGELFLDLHEKCKRMKDIGYRWVSIVPDEDPAFQCLCQGNCIGLDPGYQPLPQGVRFTRFDDECIPDWVVEFAANDDNTQRRFSKNTLLFARFNMSKVTALEANQAKKMGGINLFDFRALRDTKSASGVIDEAECFVYWPHATVHIWNCDAIAEGHVFNGTGGWKYEKDPTPFETHGGEAAAHSTRPHAPGECRMSANLSAIEQRLDRL